MSRHDTDLPACKKCGEEEFLNPETGLCLDCQLEHEENEDEESDFEIECEDCGDMLEDGFCPNGCTICMHYEDD